MTAVGFQNDVEPKEAAQVHHPAVSVLPSCSGQVKSGCKREINQFHILMGCTKSYQMAPNCHPQKSLCTRLTLTGIWAHGLGQSSVHSMTRWALCNRAVCISHVVYTDRSFSPRHQNHSSTPGRVSRCNPSIKNLGGVAVSSVLVGNPWHMFL